MIFYIAAGGHSLRGFDWKRLRGKNVIAVNRSFQMLPLAQFIYFSDQRFWDWHKDELVKHPAEKITGARLPDGLPITRYQLTGIDGLDLTPGCLRHGNNSGYAAINLSVHLGASKIILLGFDMHLDTRGKAHWHDGYITTNRASSYFKMLPHFKTLVEPLAKFGVEIFNANPNSALNDFPKVPLDSVL
jgi:hypothetical protein